jgi:hypothetical protein
MSSNAFNLLTIFFYPQSSFEHIPQVDTSGLGPRRVVGGKGASLRPGLGLSCRRHHGRPPTTLRGGLSAYLQRFSPGLTHASCTYHSSQHRAGTGDGHVPLSRDENFDMAVCLSILFPTTYKVATSANVNL